MCSIHIALKFLFFVNDFFSEEIAQWLEYWPVTPKVAGSNPVFLGFYSNRLRTGKLIEKIKFYSYNCLFSEFDLGSG
jgi:hypothetical protein